MPLLFKMYDGTRLRWWALWTGRIVSVLPVLILLMSARWKLTHDPWYVREWEDSATRRALCGPSACSSSLASRWTDFTHGSSGYGAAHRLSRRRHLRVCPARRALPCSRPLDDGPARLGGHLLARGAPSIAAPVPQECPGAAESLNSHSEQASRPQGRICVDPDADRIAD